MGKPSKVVKPVQDSFVVKVLSDPKYRGSHVILIAGQVFAARTQSEASRLFDRVLRKFPGHQPLLTYIPKADTLILWVK